MSSGCSTPQSLCKRGSSHNHSLQKWANGFYKTLGGLDRQKNPHSEHYQTHRNIVYEMITPLGSLGALQETWIAVALIASTCGADRFAGTVK